MIYNFEVKLSLLHSPDKFKSILTISSCFQNFQTEFQPSFQSVMMKKLGGGRNFFRWEAKYGMTDEEHK